MGKLSAGLLHEIKDQTGLVRGLTKWNRVAESPSDIAPSFGQAFRELLSGRPRPVGLEVAHDFLSAQLPGPAPQGPADVSPPAAEPADPKLLHQAARMIDAARMPVLYVGGGIFPAEATKALRAFAERIGAPVVMSDNGRGALDDHHPLAMNPLAGPAVFQHADLVLVIGTRFIDALTPTPSWPAGKARFIHINLDPADLGAPRAAEIAIKADAPNAL